MNNATTSSALPTGTESRLVTAEQVQKILSLIDKGLTSGLGENKPGQMCIEAVICHVLEGRQSDRPQCVAPVLRSLKIRLNDANWSSNQARARGMRRLGLAQLGSAGVLDETEFCRRVVDYALRKSTPRALRSAASICKDEKHKAALCEAADRCEKEGTRQAAYAAAKKTAHDLSLAGYAEDIVQILIEMKAPGCQWLYLTEAA